MTISSHLHCRLALLFAVTCFSPGCCSTGLGQALTAVQGPSTAAALVDAPFAHPHSEQIEPSAPLVPARKYALVIEPELAAQPLNAPEKLVFSFREVARPITLLPGLYSAGYEQLFNTDPKYGHDAGAFGDKLGAAMLRSASVRVFSNGILAAALHQDPRYYRIAHGSIIHRGLLSARQAVVRRGDNGANQINFSGIGGRAAAAALTATYYPEPSVTTSVVVSTFLTSIATDAGGNLVVEFLPSIVRKFPIMRKLGFE